MEPCAIDQFSRLPRRIEAGPPCRRRAEEKATTRSISFGVPDFRAGAVTRRGGITANDLNMAVDQQLVDG